MSDPSDHGVLSVAPPLLWGVVSAAVVIVAVVRSSRIRRGSVKGAGKPWEVLGPEWTWALAGAAVGYAVGAVIERRFGWGDLSESMWLPSFAASAVAYVTGRRLGGRARWAAAMYAVLGAVVLGPLFD
ncbi:hypothetical protein [Streptomyces sp. NBC_00102]|uniref:hypothetical protein n=1 Tax=Streptomyces sp. NBC_00102 TaxID=2975652 RepID=UPI0022531ECB|nr:hypothetical protein [Streptomyces sp. NBC_00102]MCX5398898.1 hypothetical protein [Streptomyces sp. NBC_00102]